LRIFATEHKSISRDILKRKQVLNSLLIPNLLSPLLLVDAAGLLSSLLISFNSRRRRKWQSHTGSGTLSMLNEYYESSHEPLHPSHNTDERKFNNIPKLNICFFSPLGPFSPSFFLASDLSHSQPGIPALLPIPAPAGYWCDGIVIPRIES